MTHLKDVGAEGFLGGPLFCRHTYQMLRTVAERLSRNRSFRRRLPNGATIYVSPDAGLTFYRFRPRVFHDLPELVDKYVTAESVVWDIGANCGVLAFSALGASSILAVEPDPFFCHLMQRSNAINGNKVNILCAAISGQQSLEQFSIARRGRGSNYLSSVEGRSQSGGARGYLTVPTLTLDYLLEFFPAPTLLKVDVEGAEIALLSGASSILSTVRSVIHIEVGTEQEQVCRQILEKASYHITGEFNWLAIPNA